MATRRLPIEIETESLQLAHGLPVSGPRKTAHLRSHHNGVGTPLTRGWKVRDSFALAAGLDEFPRHVASKRQCLGHGAALACIEVLSPDDRLARVRERVNDYLAFGVAYVWLLDPATRQAFRWTREGMHEVHELRTENPQIVVPVSALFEE